MLGSAFFALIISVLPHHRSPFLFSIGLFSSYLLISGFRSLKFRTSNPNLKGAAGVALVKNEAQGLLHPCKLADFTFYTSDRKGKAWTRSRSNSGRNQENKKEGLLRQCCAVCGRFCEGLPLVAVVVIAASLQVKPVQLRI